MCIAIFKPGHAPAIPYERFMTCATNNPDGMGFMWVENGQIRMLKSVPHCPTKQYMSFRDDVMAFYKDYARVEATGVNIVLHFRIMTHGKICLANTHPFFVNDEQTLAYVHNGMLDVPSTDEKSDSRVFGQRFLRYLNPAALNDLVALKLLDEIVSPSKIILMDNQSQVTIINASAGTWKEGSWYSNSSFYSYKYSAYGYSGWEADWESSTTSGASCSTSSSSARTSSATTTTASARKTALDENYATPFDDYVLVLDDLVVCENCVEERTQYAEGSPLLRNIAEVADPGEEVQCAICGIVIGTRPMFDADEVAQMEDEEWRSQLTKLDNYVEEQRSRELQAAIGARTQLTLVKHDNTEKAASGDAEDYGDNAQPYAEMEVTV